MLIAITLLLSPSLSTTFWLHFASHQPYSPLTNCHWTGKNWGFLGEACRTVSESLARKLGCKQQKYPEPN